MADYSSMMQPVIARANKIIECATEEGLEWNIHTWEHFKERAKARGDLKELAALNLAQWTLEQ